MTAAMRIDPPATPAGRLAALIALAARSYPGLGPPARDAEPADDLGGPWESAVWSRAGRTVKAVCFPAATQLSTRLDRRLRAVELYRDHAAAGPRLVARLAWLMED